MRGRRRVGIAGVVVLLMAAGVLWSRGSAQRHPTSLCPHPLTAPISLKCAAYIAEGAGWTHNMNDQTRAVDVVSMSPTEAKERFGLDAGTEENVQLVLLDAWPRYSLRWYTPPPGELPEPTATVQDLAAVFQVPYTTTVQVKMVVHLDGGRYSSVGGIDQKPLDWR